MRRTLIALLLVCAPAVVAGPHAAAQITSADSAAVLFDAALRLEAEGQRAAADALLRYILRRHSGTPHAAEAERRLAAATRVRDERSGRGELMVWYTIYGAWLGVAVPAALGVDEPEPYGVGLLAGAPLGLLAARAYGRSSALSSGQARVIAFGSQWGTWQGLAWREVLDINQTETICYGPGGSPPCETFESDGDRAPWAAMVVGGLTGAVSAALLARGRDIPSGRATFAIHGAYWGTLYGLAGSILADAQDAEDGTLTWALAGGNIGLLAAALGGPDGISSGRVWLITAGGIGGAAAGFGVDLLAQPESEKSVVGIPMVMSAIGMILAANWTRDYDKQRGEEVESGNALLNVRGGRLSLGIPAPMPAVLERADAPGRPRLGVRVPLFELRH
jgi:hypothetical protein